MILVLGHLYGMLGVLSLGEFVLWSAGIKGSFVKGWLGLGELGNGFLRWFVDHGRFMVAWL